MARAIKTVYAPRERAVKPMLQPLGVGNYTRNSIIQCVGDLLTANAQNRYKPNARYDNSPPQASHVQSAVNGQYLPGHVGG